MAAVEVEESDWLAAQRVIQLYNRLSGDPEAKKDFQRAVKKIAPQYQTEEEAAESLAKPYVAQLEATKKELEEFKKRYEEKEAKAKEASDDADLAQRLERVTKKFNLTDDGIKQLTDTMIAKHIANPEDAMKVIHFDKPKEPVGSGFESNRWLIDENAKNGAAPAFNEWLKDPERTADKELARAMNDIYAARERAS